jgi:hypothetical protein
MYSRKFAGVTITAASYSKQGIVAVVGVSKAEWVREIAIRPAELDVSYARSLTNWVTA